MNETIAETNNPRLSGKARQQAIRGKSEKSSRGLRSQIIISLGIVLLPAALVACIWTFAQNNRLYNLKINSAERATSLVADEISALLYDTSIYTADKFITNKDVLTDPIHCHNRLTNILRERPEHSFIALFVNQRLVCFGDTANYFSSDEQAATEIAAIRDRLKEQQTRTTNPLVLRSEDGRDLLLGISVMPNETTAEEIAPDVFVVSALRTTALSFSLTVTRLGIDRGTAIITPQGDIIAQSSSSSLADDWFPEGATTLTDALAKLDQNGNFTAFAQSGDPFHYFISSTINPDILVLTGYPDALLFASERSILWSSLLTPLLMLAIAGAGSLWATERYVVKWIRYLQRVTRVYGSGRLSVRAIHIRDAPREFAELGEAFNDMASNIADQSYQREHAVYEKATLLRELHHRVKNNFQVIVSLLSLHKRAEDIDGKVASDTNSNNLRFIEDHIRAMSVAYRVGYSSGDLGEAPLAELIHDLINSLRSTTELKESDIIEVLQVTGYFVDLDRAIGIALYIAAIFPAYLDAIQRYTIEGARPKALISAEATLSAGDNHSQVRSITAVGYLRLTLGTVPALAITPSPLQERLARAYIRQLNAKTAPGKDPGDKTIIIPLENAANT